ncbi:thioesterase family protein [Bradyrhizobium sp. CCGB01]|uniref:acyl-CoA thioesterase n=1 Tax=Bradyrhizobium sp. CCGB01 TaxID=2949634 RepID=UPI0020B22A95|nr:thioesterase family protein [Bradyrhizobium sp. CCGB01]MCP3407284.1 acyl-CoA thioesterase [Bradyrhizobium sp. CCGB01]
MAELTQACEADGSAPQWENGYPNRRNRSEQHGAVIKMQRSDFWFFHPFRVRYSEVDGQKVVFNAHYLTYFDTAITEYFRALGHDLFADTQATGIDFHAVRAVVEFKAPVLFDQEIDVGVRVAKLGRSSVTFELGIFGKATDELYTSGEIVWVNTDQRTHQSVPVSASFRDMLVRREAHLA